MADWFDDFARAQRTRILACLDQRLARVQAARDEAVRQQLRRFPGDYAEFVLTVRTHASGRPQLDSDDDQSDDDQP